ncbi:hypothetical protein L208DRAFT_1235128 [Tricholoma matsutake]|nr:hypothetical protein L208DRAFT_1235128 [Tricholoma matsutake 945]
MNLVCDNEESELPNVVCVAAQAILILINKYYTLMKETELYVIAIVMCPDKKLKWFKDHGHTAAQIRDIKKTVLTHWNESYKGDEEVLPPALAAKSKWVVPTESDNNQNTDTILTYLADPVIKSSAVKEAGGYMKYWNQATEHQPRVGKMGLDFYSAPGQYKLY